MDFIYLISHSTTASCAFIYLFVCAPNALQSDRVGRCRE